MEGIPYVYLTGKYIWTDHLTSVYAAGGHCYLVRDEDKRSFAGALEVCQREVAGGNLVSIGSSIENDFLITILRHSHVVANWIGLREDMGSEPNGWRGLEWTDHSPYTYSNWHVTYTPSNAAVSRLFHKTIQS